MEVGWGYGARELNSIWALQYQYFRLV